MKVTTAVTCPTVRIHPAIIAQAAATSAVLLEGRFALGVGSGEALNEHILGDRWPAADERLEMLEEAVAGDQALWEGGVQSHRGAHYRVENARIYDLPETLPPISSRDSGPSRSRSPRGSATATAPPSPDAEAVERFRSEAGAGEARRGRHEGRAVAEDAAGADDGAPAVAKRGAAR